MSDDFDLEVRRRADAYLIVAREVGVIVRSTDLNAGLQEALERIAAILDLYREAGLTPERSEPSEPSVVMWRDSLPPALVSGIILSGLLLLASVPVVSAAARLSSAIESLAVVRAGVNTESIGRNAIDTIIRLGSAMDKVTPERKDELRLAVRRIMNGISPIIEEVRDAGTRATVPTPPPPH